MPRRKDVFFAQKNILILLFSAALQSNGIAGVLQKESESQMGYALKLA